MGVWGLEFAVRMWGFAAGSALDKTNRARGGRETTTDRMQQTQKTKRFTLNIETMQLTCPDGTIKTMEMTDLDAEEEFYAEWQDIGVFYYPESKQYWFQGQLPTYPGNPTLDFARLRVPGYIVTR